MRALATGPPGLVDWAQTFSNLSFPAWTAHLLKALRVFFNPFLHLLFCWVESKPLHCFVQILQVGSYKGRLQKKCSKTWSFDKPPPTEWKWAQVTFARNNFNLESLGDPLNKKPQQTFTPLHIPLFKWTLLKSFKNLVSTWSWQNGVRNSCWNTIIEKIF